MTTASKFLCGFLGTILGALLFLVLVAFLVKPANAQVDLNQCAGPLSCPTVATDHVGDFAPGTTFKTYLDVAPGPLTSQLCESIFDINFEPEMEFQSVDLQWVDPKAGVSCFVAPGPISLLECSYTDAFESALNLDIRPEAEIAITWKVLALSPTDLLIAPEVDSAFSFLWSDANPTPTCTDLPFLGDSIETTLTVPEPTMAAGLFPGLVLLVMLRRRSK